MTTRCGTEVPSLPPAMSTRLLRIRTEQAGMLLHRTMRPYKAAPARSHNGAEQNNLRVANAYC